MILNSNKDIPCLETLLIEKYTFFYKNKLPIRKVKNKFLLGFVNFVFEQKFVYNFCFSNQIFAQNIFYVCYEKP